MMHGLEWNKLDYFGFFFQSVLGCRLHSVIITGPTSSFDLIISIAISSQLLLLFRSALPVPAIAVSEAIHPLAALRWFDHVSACFRLLNHND